METTMQIADFENEEQFTTNPFHQLTGLTLDDLAVYREPLAALYVAVRGLATKQVTHKEACYIMARAARSYQSIDDRLEHENAA